MCAKTPPMPLRQFRSRRSLANSLLRRPQAGQALVEALVGSLALVPLLLAVLWLGKVISMQQSLVQASRLLAFECTVRAHDCDSEQGQARLADEIRQRVFGRLDSPVLSNAGVNDLPPASERNPLWVDAAGRPLLARMSDVGIRIRSQSFDAGLSLATSRERAGIGNAMSLLTELAGPARFGLDLTGGLREATVQVAAVPVPGKLGAFPGLRLQARAAVLSDAWTAVGPTGDRPDTVQARVDRGARLLPAYEMSLDARYAPTLGFLSLMNAVGLEPAAGSFRYHQSDVDAVPSDRIGEPTR